MPKEKSKIHPEILKMYNSPIYRKRVKRIVALIKSSREMPWGVKLPGNPPKVKSTATEKEREQHAKRYANYANRASAHFWAQPYEAPHERRVAQSTKQMEED